MPRREVERRRPVPLRSGTIAAVWLLGLSSCGSGPASGLVDPPDGPPSSNVDIPAVEAQLVVPTYDGSGEAVHPDVVHFPSGWRGWEYWMALTPYPRGKADFENPSIVVSHDGVVWQVPRGLTNPIVSRPAAGDAYNSDPDLWYDPAHDRLLMAFRQVRGGMNLISTIASADGVQWGEPRLQFRRPNHGMISPTFVLTPSGGATVWYVDGGPNKCKNRTTRVLMQESTVADPWSSGPAEVGWSPPRVADLRQPGYDIWHLDVIFNAAKQEYWAVYPAYRPEQCGADDLFFARSADGIRWTSYAVPILEHDDYPWSRSTLYRASTLYDAGRDVIRIYFSAAAPGPVWHLGFVEFGYSGLLAWLEHQGPRSAAARWPPEPARSEP